MTDQDPKTGKFVKGNKANPGGRPRTDLSISALIDAAVSESDWVVIIKRLKDKASHGDLKAVEMLMDRRFGKPTQTSVVDAKLVTQTWKEFVEGVKSA